MTTKTCSKCGVEKDVSMFSKTKTRKGGLNCWCKDCWKIYYQQNREVFTKQSRDRYYLNRQHHLDRHLFNTYGITRDEFNALLGKQGGGCAICGKKETALANNSKTVMRLAVDHDHKTGKIRGLLCCRCNHAIGQMLDDPKIIQNAVAYLSAAYTEALKYAGQLSMDLPADDNGG